MKTVSRIRFSDWKTDEQIVHQWATLWLRADELLEAREDRAVKYERWLLEIEYALDRFPRR